MSDQQQVDVPQDVNEPCPWCRRDCGFAVQEAEAIATYYLTLIERGIPADLADRLTTRWFDAGNSCDHMIDLGDFDNNDD